MLIPIHDSTNYYIHIDSGPIQGTEAAVASIVARNAGQDLTNDSTSIQLHFQHPKPPNITASAMFKNDAVVKSSSATVSTTLPVKINQGIVDTLQHRRKSAQQMPAIFFYRTDLLINLYVRTPVECQCKLCIKK